MPDNQGLNLRPRDLYLLDREPKTENRNVTTGSLWTWPITDDYGVSSSFVPLNYEPIFGRVKHGFGGTGRNKTMFEDYYALMRSARKGNRTCARGAATRAAYNVTKVEEQVWRRYSVVDHLASGRYWRFRRIVVHDYFWKWNAIVEVR